MEGAKEAWEHMELICDGQGKSAESIKMSVIFKDFDIFVFEDNSVGQRQFRPKIEKYLTPD